MDNLDSIQRLPDNTRKCDLYQVVREEDKRTHFPNYAAQNHLEHFAELPTTYFAGNTYFPHRRTELAK